MGIGDVFRAIHSPVETFSRIVESNPSLFDGLLFFIFVQTFVLGFCYMFMSVMPENYGMGSIIIMLIGTSPLPFLSSPGLVSYLISMFLSFVEILILSLVFHGFSKFVNKSPGSFSSIFTLLSISQIVSIFPVLIIPLTNISYTMSQVFVVPMFGYIFVTTFWKYLLYGISVRTNYRLPEIKVAIAFILSFLVFFLLYPLVAAVFLSQIGQGVLDIGTFGLPSVRIAKESVSNVLGSK
jgi:hypothetical protein